MNMVDRETSLPIELICPVQHYPWGERGVHSLVHRLSRSVQGEGPCAELWIGAHPKSPALAKLSTGLVPLDTLIRKKATEILGPAILDRFGPYLPMLFKILSVAEPLSIQAHPDQETARVLHRESSHDRTAFCYPDPNHKPEVAIALSPTELLCGFRPLSEIRANLATTPELQGLVGTELTKRILSSPDGPDSCLIRDLYRTVLHSTPEAVFALSQQLYQRLHKASPNTPADKWAIRLEKFFPRGDVGLFSLYLLNIETLMPGEAVFIPPNEVHAYLTGDLAECMANSDNVVRAGFTSKPKDLNTLIEILNYEPGLPSKVKVKVESIDSIDMHTFLLRKEDVAEFFLVRITGGPGTHPFKTGPSPHIIFCLQGHGRICSSGQSSSLSPGSAYLVPYAAKSYSLELEEHSCLFQISVP